MGKFGDALAAGGKGMLDGMAQMGGLPGNNLTGKGIPGSGLDMAGGPMSGIGLMNLLFDKLGLFGKKKEEEIPGYAPTGIVGPRD